MEVERAIELRGEGTAQALVIEGRDDAVVERDRGVGDGDQRPLGRDRVDQPRERLSIRDIAGGDLGLAAELAELGRQLRHPRRLGSAAADQQQVAGTVALREPSCEKRAEAGGAAGDQDGAIGE